MKRAVSWTFGIGGLLLIALLVWTMPHSPLPIVEKVFMPDPLPVLGSQDIPGEAGPIVVSGRYAYVAAGRAGLAIFDVSDPTAPVLVSTYDTTGFSLDIAVSGKYAYVADSQLNLVEFQPGLRIIDISDPAKPILTASLNINANSITLAAPYAYVTDDNGIAIIDISNPTRPILTSTFGMLGLANAVAVSGQFAYVAANRAGVVIIDVSDPSAPTLAGNRASSFSFEASDIAISGHYAYVAASEEGLRVLDLSNSTLPEPVGRFKISKRNDSGHKAILTKRAYANLPPLPETISKVSVFGNYALLGGCCDGGRIIDISNSTQPTLVATVDFDAQNGLFLSDKYLYVTDSLNRINIIDANSLTSNN